MRRATALLTLLMLAGVALSGCTGDAAGDDDPVEQLPRHAVTGRVLTPAFNPVAGATVWIGQSGHCTTDGVCTADLQVIEDRTDASGDFRLEGIWAGNGTTLHIEHPDYADADHTVDVPGPAVNLNVVPVDRVVPYQQPFPFNGYIECGADHLIFAGSCDEFAGAVAEPVEGTFADEREFTFEIQDDWRTLVIDIAFDEPPPTLDGLRLAAYAPDNDAEVLTYERYHQAGSTEPFTLRIEPGVDYGDALPAPENATTIRLEVFPRGHGYYAVCDPSGDTCFTGVGTSARIDFQIVATVFYHEAAPEGWTLLDA